MTKGWSVATTSLITQKLHIVAPSQINHKQLNDLFYI